MSTRSRASRVATSVAAAPVTPHEIPESDRERNDSRGGERGGVGGGGESQPDERKTRDEVGQRGGPTSDRGEVGDNGGGGKLMSPDAFFGPVLTEPVAAENAVARVETSGYVDFAAMRTSVAAAERDANGRVLFEVEARNDGDREEYVRSRSLARVLRFAVCGLQVQISEFVRRCRQPGGTGVGGNGGGCMRALIESVDFSFVETQDPRLWSDGCVCAAYVVWYGKTGAGPENPNAVAVYHSPTGYDLDEADAADERQLGTEAMGKL